MSLASHRSSSLTCTFHSADPPILHGPYVQWTRKVGNKTVTKLLTPEQRARYQAWFDNDKKLKELVTKLEALSLQEASEAEGWEPI